MPSMAYWFRKLNPIKTRPVPPSARDRYLSELRWALATKQNWDYSEIRPIPHPDQKGRIVTDCSGAVTFLAERARVGDPNGRGFDGLGYTGTILDHCRRITRDSLQPGDLVVFGAAPGHHVCAVLEAGPDPLLFSHGKQGDPCMVTLSGETAGQAAHPGVSYLSFLP